MGDEGLEVARVEGEMDVVVIYQARAEVAGRIDGQVYGELPNPEPQAFNGEGWARDRPQPEELLVKGCRAIEIGDDHRHMMEGDHHHLNHTNRLTRFSRYS